MDGNLLDPDNADATLAKEWSLPELPAGVERNHFRRSLTPQTNKKSLDELYYSIYSAPVGIIRLA